MMLRILPKILLLWLTLFGIPLRMRLVLFLRILTRNSNLGKGLSTYSKSIVWLSTLKPLGALCWSLVTMHLMRIPRCLPLLIV